MPTRCKLLAGLWLIAALQAQAQTPDCENPQTQREMNQCAAEDLDREDQQLNRLYNQYRATLQESERQALKQAQLAWITFRDLDCTLVASAYEGGSMQPMIHATCLAARTRERVGQLKQMIED